jgi:hypothetical protein
MNAVSMVQIFTECVIVKLTEWINYTKGIVKYWSSNNENSLCFSSCPAPSQNQPASPSLHANQYTPHPQFTAVQHHSQQSTYAWNQSMPPKRPFLQQHQEQLPSFSAARFYSPATQSMPCSVIRGPVPMMSQQQQQGQTFWGYQQQQPPPQYEGLAAALNSNCHSVSPHSVDPSLSDLSSPPKTDSPYEGNLEICEDADLEEETELVEALQTTSQTSSQTFSQEFWDYQAQQDQYQDN